MKMTTAIQGNLTILCISLRKNKPYTETRQVLQEALDAVWAAVWTPGNIHAQVAWQRRFPGGVKPTVEEFIVRLSEEVKNAANPSDLPNNLLPANQSPI